MSTLRSVKHQDEGISLATFSFATGISVKQLESYCKRGRIVGARKHLLTRKWLIYPPARLLTGRLL